MNNTDRIAIFLFFWRPSLQESIFQHALLTFIATGCLVLAACNNLWGVKQTTDISFTVNVQELLDAVASRSALVDGENTPQPFGMSKSGGSLTDDFPEDWQASLRVTLYKTSGEVVERQNRPLTKEEAGSAEVAENIRVVFAEVPLGLNIYAEVELIATYNGKEYVDGLFRSDSIVVRGGLNNLVCRWVEPDIAPDYRGYNCSKAVGTSTSSLVDSTWETSYVFGGGNFTDTLNFTTDTTYTLTSVESTSSITAVHNGTYTMQNGIASLIPFHPFTVKSDGNVDFDGMFTFTKQP